MHFGKIRFGGIVPLLQLNILAVFDPACTIIFGKFGVISIFAGLTVFFFQSIQCRLDFDGIPAVKIFPQFAERLAFIHKLAEALDLIFRERAAGLPVHIIFHAADLFDQFPGSVIITQIDPILDLLRTPILQTFHLRLYS